MIDIEKHEWISELLECGDLSVDQDDETIQNKVQRYWCLIDMVDGSEDQETFNAILNSIQDEGNTAVYESTYNALWLFPPENFSKYFVAALPGFIDRVGPEAGRFLLGLCGWAVHKYLPLFNHELASAPLDTQNRIMAFVRQEEKENGWFEGNAGLIKPEKIA